MKRLASIDFLRGIAVILVLFRHHWIGVDALQHIGWIGVDLFFVLSGFLVSGLLFAEQKKYGDVHKFRFLIRRGFKIYPLFYLSLLITFAVSYYVPVMQPEVGFKGQIETWASELLFLQNYFYLVWGHHWSLAVEEHFYLLVALFFPLIVKYIRFAPLVFAGCIAMRLLTDDPHAFNQTHLRLDSLFAGVCISYWYHYKNLHHVYRKYRKLLIPLCFVPLGFAFSNPYNTFTTTMGFTLLYISFGALLIVFLYADVQKYLWSPVTKVGFYSYGIYLFHGYLLKFVVGETYLQDVPRDFTWTVIPSFLIFFFGSIALGSAMSYVVEIPTLKLRDKWFPKRSAGTATTPSPAPHESLPQLIPSYEPEGW